MRDYVFEIRIGDVGVTITVPRAVAKQDWSLGANPDLGAVRAQAIARATRLLGEKTALAGESWQIHFTPGGPPEVKVSRQR